MSFDALGFLFPLHLLTLCSCVCVRLCARACVVRIAPPSGLHLHARSAHALIAAVSDAITEAALHWMGEHVDTISTSGMLT